MTPAEVRQAIAEAASAVDGVNVTPYYRQITAPGQGAVKFERTDYPNGFGGLVTWQVLVTLPQDQRTAEMWIDTNGPALRGAVEAELAVRSMTVTQLTTPDGATILAVVVEGQREE